MTKVRGFISQRGVKGTISQLDVRGTISQKGVKGTMVQTGHVNNAPVFVSVEVGTGGLNVLILLYDRNVDPWTIPDPSDYSVSFSGGAASVASLIIPVDGDTSTRIVLNLNRAIVFGETGTVSYTRGENPVKSLLGDKAVSLTDETVTNNVPQIPVFVSATIEDATPTIITIVMDIAMDETYTETDEITIAGKTVSSVTVSGTDIIVTVTEAFISTDTPTVVYTAGTLEGATGGNVADFSESVTNNIVGYCDEYQAWYNAMPNKPPDSVATAQNTFVQTLVDADIWTGFDIAYLLAQYSNTASEALINIVNPGTNNATLIGNPAFVSLEGFTGDGGVNYITTNFNGNSGVNYTLNNCSVGVYSRDMIAANTWLLFASEGGNLIIIYDLGGTRTNRVYLNDSGYGNAVVIPAAGMCIHGRSDANTVHNFINKSYASAVASSSAIPNTNILLISDSFSQLSFAFAGRYFNEAEMGIIQDALEVYMDNNGKGVI